MGMVDGIVLVVGAGLDVGTNEGGAVSIVVGTVLEKEVDGVLLTVGPRLGVTLELG